MEVQIQSYDGEVWIKLPKTVELQVTETEPGIKGDTAATKSATVETGYTLNVPYLLTKVTFLLSTLVTEAYISRG